MCGTIEQASRRWRGGGRDAKLIAARRRLAEIYDREDHERDVEAGVPVAVAAMAVILVRRTRCSLIVVRQRV